MRLTEITLAVGRLRNTSADSRREELASLLDDLRALAVDRDVSLTTRGDITLRALRAISPRTARPESPEATVEMIAQLLETPRGPGRPPSQRPLAPARTIRLPEEIDQVVRGIAEDRGTSVSSVIGDLIEQALGEDV